MSDQPEEKAAAPEPVKMVALNKAGRVVSLMGTTVSVLTDDGQYAMGSVRVNGQGMLYVEVPENWDRVVVRKDAG